MADEIKKSRIYTKKGDQGKTFLVSGSCVEKFNPRVEAYGTVDELNSSIGLLRYHLGQTPLGPNQNYIKQDVLLENIQNHLFRIGSILACEDFKIQRSLPPVTSVHIELLEKTIDEYDHDLPALKNFILPAGGLIANHYHILRTICRRSERRAAEVDLKEMTSEPTKNCLIYLNRLSDLFFVLARWNNWVLKISDTAWDKEK